MGQNYGGGVVMERAFYHFTGINGRTVNRAKKQFFVLKHPVFRVQKQTGKYFPFPSRQLGG